MNMCVNIYIYTMISTGTYARDLHMYTDIHTQAVTQHNIYDMCGKGTTERLVP